MLRELCAIPLCTLWLKILSFKNSAVAEGGSNQKKSKEVAVRPPKNPHHPPNPLDPIVPILLRRGGAERSL